MSTTQQGGAPPPQPPPPPPSKPFWSVKITVALALNSPSGEGYEAFTAGTLEAAARHEDAAWAFDQAVSQVRALAPVLQTGMAAEKGGA